jgi:Arc/MetJ-type ribon-helix-helix transcriptional regulator
MTGGYGDRDDARRALLRELLTEKRYWRADSQRDVERIHRDQAEIDALKRELGVHDEAAFLAGNG